MGEGKGDVVLCGMLCPKVSHTENAGALKCKAKPEGIWMIVRGNAGHGSLTVKPAFSPLRHPGALYRLQLWIVINVPDCADAPPYVAVMD